ncbi:hypothetical protein AVEN_199442-1 [Araneus ventricosus]|uniref:Uncharacterized protein n=1 Tax=Araneus ventricosus TaxID=182803 RepID=A0A4Y2NWE2_ARAVE|nr:hypothetical protein AVEN_199442-1 [Araneus ventricosus]
MASYFWKRSDLKSVPTEFLGPENEGGTMEEVIASLFIGGILSLIFILLFIALVRYVRKKPQNEKRSHRNYKKNSYVKANGSKKFHIVQEEGVENLFIDSNPDPGNRRAQLLKSRSKLRGGFKFYYFHFKPLSTIEELPEPESSSVVAVRTNQYESNDDKRLSPDTVRTTEKHAFKSPAKANERDAPTVHSSSHIYARSNPDMTNMADNVTVQVSTSEVDASKSRNGLKEMKENILATKAPISSRIPSRSGERKCKIDCKLMANAPPCSNSTRMKSHTNVEDNAKSVRGAFPVPRSFSGRKNNADMRRKLLMNSADCSYEIMDKKTKRVPENILEKTISETKNKKDGEMVETSEKIVSLVSYKAWRKKKTAEMNERSEENSFQFSDKLSPTSETGKAKKLVKEYNDLSKNRSAMNVKKPRVEDVRGINKKADRKKVPSPISIKTTNISAERPSEICDMVRPLTNQEQNLVSRISTMHLKQGAEVIKKRHFVDLSDKDLIASKIKGCLHSKQADKPPETPLKNKFLPKPSETLPKSKIPVRYYETSPKVKSFRKNPETIPKGKLSEKHSEMHSETKSSSKSSAMTTERKLIPMKYEDSSKVKSLIKPPKIMSSGDTRGIRNEADFENNPSMNVHSSSSINKTKISASEANEVNEIVRSPSITKSNSSTTNS